MWKPTLEIAPGIEIPKLGIGTWGIGGYMTRNQYNDDENDIVQLQYQIDKGLTVIDTWLAQSEGYSVELIGKAIKKTNKKNLFIVSKLDVKEISDRQELINVVDRYLTILGIDHIDLLQIHLPNFVKITPEECLNTIEDVISNGKAKYFGICNSIKEDIDKLSKLTKLKITSNEINYSIINRQFETDGTIDYCHNNNIKIISYRPLNRGLTNTLSQDPVFKELITKYKKTPNQIALNWLIRQPGHMAFVKSVNRSHINENLDCMSFYLEQTDVDKINAWKYQII